MGVNDPNYRYATQTWEADGVRIDYDIAFDGGYIRQSDVVAFSVLVDEDTGLTTDRQVHTLVFLSEEIDPVTEWKTAQVRISPAVADGRRVVIFRSTEKSAALVNYTAGSILTEKNLDLANDQSVFGIAEIMDGLNAAQISIDQQVQEVIDMNVLIQEIYEQVLILLASGGIVSVQPQVFAFNGDGVETDFPLVGADVSDSGFYDTYVGGEGVEPDTDFTIITDGDPLNTIIRFTVPPGNLVRCFSVLRGFARPYTGPAPLTTLQIPIVTFAGTDLTLDRTSHEFSIISCTSASDVELTIDALINDPDVDFRDGSYFSVEQTGDGFVEVVKPDGPAIKVPVGYLVRPRGKYSMITLTCEDADTNTWVASGDLAVDGATIGLDLDGSMVKEPVNVLTPASGVVNIDCSLGSYFTLAPTANVTSITFSNLPAAGKAQTIMVLFTQDSTPRTVAFPSTFDWAGGTVPAVSTASGAKDVLAITTFNQGGAWMASLSKAHS